METGHTVGIHAEAEYSAEDGATPRVCAMPAGTGLGPRWSTYLCREANGHGIAVEHSVGLAAAA
jgi:hypothetical protein